MYRKIQQSLILGSLFTGFLFTACANKSNNAEMENTQQTAQGNTYTCPMHPEVTGNEGDKCPKCGMDLVASAGEDVAKVDVALTTSPDPIEAGKPARLQFTFKKSNQPVALELAHERKVHLMVVDENLAWFRHIHPLVQSDSSYAVSETFPAGGKYILYADFKPNGAASVVDKKEIIVRGTLPSGKAERSPRLVSVVDGYTVTLENGNDLRTNRSQPLEIAVTYNGKKLPADAIEPYLGAAAHIAMIGTERKDFLHIHPIADKRFPIYAETQIAQPGIYRIWVEFQTNGKVHTANFTVSVQQGNDQHQEHQHQH